MTPGVGAQLKRRRRRQAKTALTQFLSHLLVFGKALVTSVKAVLALGAALFAGMLTYLATLGGNIDKIDTLISKWTGKGDPKLVISSVMIEPIAFREIKVIFTRVRLPIAYGVAFNVKKAEGIALKECAIQLRHRVVDLGKINTYLRKVQAFDVPAEVVSERRVVPLPSDKDSSMNKSLGEVFMFLKCVNAVTDAIPFPNLANAEPRPSG